MDAPLAEVSTGSLRGATHEGINRFLGVPYAAAPQRFERPTPHPRWDGIRDATAFGATAPQAPYGPGLANVLPTVIVEGDNCLNLNVWTPSGAAALPVMVWVHGGGLMHGSNALAGYDGTAFARDGVVFVALNYRLGAEGFSVLDEAPTNIGLSDVVAGLEWVQREITAFGGDPGNVTVFGQSAGSFLLGALLAHPKAHTMFNRAILQSGAPTARPLDQAKKITTRMAKHLGIPTRRSAFAQLTPAELVEAQEQVTAGTSPITGGASFSLAIGDDLIPRDPMEAIVAGAGRDIPLLIGSTTEEYRLWFIPTGLIDRISATLFTAARFKFRIGRRILGKYRANRPGASRGELFGVLATDILLRLPVNRIADARLASGAPTYVYEFAWRSPVQELGAAHAVELGFVFDGLARSDSIALAGANAPQQLANEMHAAWVAFATTGTPGWTAWNDKRPVQVFDSPASAVINAPREDERAVWDHPSTAS